MVVRYCRRMNIARRLLVPLCLMAPLVAGSGCMVEEREDDVGSTIDPLSEFSPVEVIDGESYALPIREVDVVAGVVGRFFVWEDLSAGYMLSSADSAAQLPLEDIDGRTIAEAFWALSAPGTEVPQSLVEHHEAVRAQLGRPPGASSKVMMSKDGWPPLLRPEPIWPAWIQSS